MERSANPDDYQDIPRALAAMPKRYPAGFVIPPHRHPRAQLTFSRAGAMTITTQGGMWVVPPQRAVWIPAETEHSITMTSPVEMVGIYIEPGASPHLPRSACVIAVSRLLRELILEAATLPLLYDETGRDGRVMALILDEVRAVPALPLHLPRPHDARLVRLCEELAVAPASRRNLAAWSAAVGSSPRNLARLFLRETGMSFGAWRRRALLLASLSRLAAGEPVTNVALDLGYDSPSAFTAMFRRTLGVTPSRYFAPG
ncbi:MAG TPA: helix-turn-helix transcriptional regulator [Stellaceae bacterium]|nr:helix-turn-helix transcriptional regulator [Stellaceae bacterium]